MKSNVVSLIVLLLAVVFGGLFHFLHSRLGFGAPFESQPDFTHIRPVLSEESLEVIAELPLPPGNIAVSGGGRVFFNFHPEHSSDVIKILELTNKNSWRPLLDENFQASLVSVLSLRIHEESNTLWLLDFAHHGFGGIPKLVGVKLGHKSSEVSQDKVIEVFNFPPEVAGLGSMLNDLVIDPSGNFIYIVDTSIVGTTPAIIVYSVTARKAYRVLDSHPALRGSSVFLNVSSHPIKFGPFGLTLNVDSVALDRSGSELFVGAVTSSHMYSISTSHLLAYASYAEMGGERFNKIREELTLNLRRVSLVKPVTDGMTTDAGGNIWMTAFEHGAVALARPRSVASGDVAGGRVFDVVKVAQSDRLLRWPDGFSFGPDGLYVTASALHYKFARLGDIKSFGPFHIVRISRENIEKVVGKDSWPTSGQ